MPTPKTTKSKGRESFFNKKYGPLPLWAWLAIATALLYYYEKKQSGTSSTSTSTNATTGGSAGGGATTGTPGYSGWSTNGSGGGSSGGGGGSSGGGGSGGGGTLRGRHRSPTTTTPTTTPSPSAPTSTAVGPSTPSVYGQVGNSGGIVGPKTDIQGFPLANTTVAQQAVFTAQTNNASLQAGSGATLDSGIFGPGAQAVASGPTWAQQVAQFPQLQ